jgi:hypothetical protein
MNGNFDALLTGARPAAARAITHRNALAAALSKAAMLERLDPRGDPYGAAGQALEDFVKREAQIVARCEDVTGWISTATERRWINEMRYQRRRGYSRLDAPIVSESNGTLGDLTADRGPAVHEIVELRERLHDVAGEQRGALALLRARGVQERHVRIVELALVSGMLHLEIAHAVNAEFDGPRILGNTVTQIISRQRDRLEAEGAFPTVVARLRRTRRAA